jgi:hypothetical protein
MENAKMLTCTNKACGKAFSKPLQTINFRKNGNLSYDACPYCLTEIDSAELETLKPLKKPNSNLEVSIEKNSPEDTKQESACGNHFGYLKEKKKEQPIPEECILCSKLIDCMLGTTN